MKKLPESVTTYLAPLTALQNLISRFNDRGVIIGGIAASLLGKPRLTADIDAVLLLSKDDIPQLIEAAKTSGLVSRIENAEEFTRDHRVLLLRHVESGTNIDISLGILPFEEEMIERSTVLNVADLSLRLPTPEDLIILKAVAHRPKDLIDIQEIVLSHPDLDVERLEQWIRQFADALEMPEIWDDIVNILASPK